MGLCVAAALAACGGGQSGADVPGGAAPLMTDVLGTPSASAGSIDVPSGGVAPGAAAAAAAVSPELFWYNPITGDTVAWAMNGSSRTSSASLLRSPGWQITHVADLNGDGQPDLVWQNYATGQTVVWLMNGNTTLQSQLILTAPGWRVIKTGDFNGDGKADLLWYNAQSAQTVIWLMDGITTLANQLLLTDPNWQVTQVGDFDGDGKTDLLWYSSTFQQTSIWLMNGTTSKQSGSILAAPGWQVTNVGDLDGDGKTDLIWYSASTGQTVAWLMNGLAHSASQALLSDPDWRVSKVADLNGDGKADLVWYAPAAQQTAAWLMNGTTKLSGSLLLNVPGWKVTQAVDLDANGTADLVWVNAATGQTVVWTMSGLQATSSKLILTDPNYTPILSAGAPTPYSVSGTIMAADVSTVDSDTNDPNQQGRASNNTLATAQASGNPGLVVGYVNQPGTGPAGANFAAGDTDDIYRANLVAGQVVELDFADAVNADLDLYVYDSAGNLVGTSASRSSRSECILVRTTGTFSIDVNAFKGASTYELSWSVPRLSSTCPNVTPTTAGAALFVPGEVVGKALAAPVDAGGVTTQSFLQNADIEVRSPLAANSVTLMRLPADSAQRAQALHSLQNGGRSQALSAGRATTAVHAAPSDVSAAARLAFDTVIATKLLQGSGRFAYAELNFVVEQAQAGYGAWPPNDVDLSLQPQLELIKLPQAFTALNSLSPRPTYTPIVAVVDTGVVADHPELRNMLVPGYDFVSSTAASGDGDGIDPNPNDASPPGPTTFFHGTHVSGTIAAETFNGSGMVGVAPMARIMPVRVLGVSGSGTVYDILQGMRFAAGLANDSGTLPARRADVINLSLEAAGACPSSVADVIASVRAQGSMVVAAAGNGSGAAVGYPANCAGAIAVSAIAYDGTLARYSNVGPEIAVTAPGGDSTKSSPAGIDEIFSLGATFVTDANGVTTRLPSYQSLEGTSMAAPHVSGVLAIMRAINPSITPATIDGLIAAGALTDDVGAAGRDNQFGYGRIDAYKAVLATGVAPASLPTLQVSPSTLDFGSTLTELTITATRLNGLSDTPTLYTRNSLNPLAVQLFLPTPDNPASGPFTFTVRIDRTLLAPDESLIRLNLLTQQGFSYPIDVVIAPRPVFAPSQRGVGPLYVLASSADDPTHVVASVLAQSSAPTTYTYTLPGVTVPRALVFAGVDLDNDGFICGPAEPCGIYPTAGAAAVLVMGANRAGVNFSVASGAISSSAAALTQATPRGFPRSP